MKWRNIIAGIAILILLGLNGLSLAKLYAIDFERATEKSAATVIDRHISSHAYGGTEYYPVLSMGEEQFLHQSVVAWKPQDFEVGSEVIVYYTPDQPEIYYSQYEMESIGSLKKEKWIGEVLIACIGTIYLLCERSRKFDKTGR